MAKKIHPKLKSYVGRIFYLRKVKLIPIFNHKLASNEATAKKYIERSEIFGETVWILDETNSRVCVYTKNGIATWIQKYFLAKELIVNEPKRKIYDDLTEATVFASEVIKELINEDKDKNHEKIKKLQDLVLKLNHVLNNEKIIELNDYIKND